MARLPGNHFLRSASEPNGPGVLTTLLRSYIEDRDRGALDAFFRLLYDEHFTDMAIQVHSYGPASELTVHEVIGDSMAKLLEDVVSERYRKAPKSAIEHLKYLLRRRFIDRRRYWDKNHADVNDHRESIVDRKVPAAAEVALRSESDRLTDQRLEDAILSLSETYQNIIRLRLEGLDYPRIAERLGLDEALIWSYSKRAVEALLAHLVKSAPTMVVRLQDLKVRAQSKPPAEETWPTLGEIEAALPAITERVRDAVHKLHYQGVAREELSSELGEDTLGILLRRGYDLLEARFKVSFPEAFERAAS